MSYMYIYVIHITYARDTYIYIPDMNDIATWKHACIYLYLIVYTENCIHVSTSTIDKFIFTFVDAHTDAFVCTGQHVYVT